jgi:hypothetical protein
MNKTWLGIGLLAGTLLLPGVCKAECSQDEINLAFSCGFMSCWGMVEANQSKPMASYGENKQRFDLPSFTEDSQKCYEAGYKEGRKAKIKNQNYKTIPKTSEVPR